MPTGLPRRRFLIGSAAAAATAAAIRPMPALADGAISGPWCRPLSDAASKYNYDFDMELLDAPGVNISLASLHGRAVWVNFFTSWCPPCNREASDIVGIAAKYGRQLAVIGVSVDERADAVRDFRKRHRIPYTLTMDAKGAIFKRLGFSEFPTHMFVDASGAISCVSIGDLEPPQMDNEVAVAIARAPIDPAFAASQKPIDLPNERD